MGQKNENYARLVLDIQTTLTLQSLIAKMFDGIVLKMKAASTI